jgi:hypothetical protein
MTSRPATVGKRIVTVARLTVALRSENTTVETGPFTYVLVTRDYDLATREAPHGRVYFTLSDWLVNDGITIVPAPRYALLDQDGTIAISLVANTDPTTDPAGSVYAVREVISGQPVRTYQVQIPHTAGPTVDLSTLPEL